MPELSVGIGDLVGVAVLNDFTIFDEDGTVAEFANIGHGVGNKNDGLFVFFEASEIVVALFLEGGVADREDFV